MTKGRKILRTVVLIVVVILSLKLVVDWLEKRVAHTRSRLIATTVEGLSETVFMVPKATSFEFVIGVPRPGNAESIQGTLFLMSGTNTIKRIRLNPKTVSASTWLDAKGYLGLIVGRTEQSVTLLDELLSIGETYSVKVDFALPPPKHTQLWLFYQQREIDRLGE